MIERAFRGAIRRGRRWLGRKQQSNESNGHLYPGPPFAYEDGNHLFEELLLHKHLRRPHFLWGALQGVNLARALGVKRVSLIEFGVAGGNGLTALESIAETLEPIFGVTIDIHGFDAVAGMPKPQDYRDLPNLIPEGFYPMDKERLELRLKRSKLHLGAINETMCAFIASKPAPIAFIEFDFFSYSSTLQALHIFEADQSLLLPRIHCFFRNVLGRTLSDFAGERLAISEFNAKHENRKIAKIYGLQYYLRNVGRWVDQYYIAHIFDHDLYCRYDALIQEATLNLRD